MVPPAPGRGSCRRRPRGLDSVQVASKAYSDARAIQLEDARFAEGSLRVTSYARPGKLFTANRDLMVTQAGKLKPEPFGQIPDSAVNLLRAGGLP